MNGAKAIEGAIARMKNRPSNKGGVEVEASEFTDGVKSWGDWGNNASRLDPNPQKDEAKHEKPSA